mmetsp:Transcript_3339/g.12090  ORF Transcript_3339/g.12090 Transcript_3339/m.12090 type:complete len:504 (+) Transcript_3339:160-1671(+)
MTSSIGQLWRGVRRRPEASILPHTSNNSESNDCSSVDREALGGQQSGARSVSGESNPKECSALNTGHWPLNRGMAKNILLCILLATVATAIFLPSALVEIEHVIVRQARILGQNRKWSELKVYLVPGTRRTYEKAKAYYMEQKPLFEEAAKNFSLHWYFSHTIVPDGYVGWYDMISCRTIAMASLLVNEGRDDANIEKDKCQMYSFLQLNKLPIVPLLGSVWRDDQQFVKDMCTSDDTELGISAYPVFVKSCHLTQGSSKGTTMIRSRPQLDQLCTSGQLEKWVEEKWVYRANDWERPWRKEGNMLTDNLKPGFILQGSAGLSYNPYTDKMQILELKVEVLWGRAYLATSNDVLKGTIFLRDGTIEIYPGGWGQAMTAHVLEDRMVWLQEEPRYLECVWRLAEYTAILMSADQVRIDIFIIQSDPEGCVINENSLSSGAGYAMHFDFLSRVWADPYRDRLFATYNNGLKVYEQTAEDLPPGMKYRLLENPPFHVLRRQGQVSS